MRPTLIIILSGLCLLAGPGTLANPSTVTAGDINTGEPTVTAGNINTGEPTVTAAPIKTPEATTKEHTTHEATTHEATTHEQTTEGTTTQAYTTEEPFTPIAAGGVVDYTYTLNDTTLLKVTFEASFSVNYPIEEDDSTNETSQWSGPIYMPDSSQLENSTDLSEDCQTITAHFSWYVAGHRWSFTLVYNVSDPPKDTDMCDFKKQDDWKSFEYELSGMGLDFRSTHVYFPNTTWADGEKERCRNTSLHYFNTDSESSYTCESTVEYDVSPDKWLVTLNNYQGQAFYFEKDNKFDTAKACDADIDNGSSVVPIIVGCVLAGLIIITLIAYFIGRWRQSRQGGYQQL